MGRRRTVAMADPRRVALKHEERFPHGAYAVAVSPIAEYDGDRGRTGAQSRDRDTGLPLWGIEVLDPDPDARNHQVRVRIAAAEEPELPPAVAVPGVEHGLRPVWFGGLVGTPYMDTNGRRPRVAWSLRAETMTPPAPAGSPPGTTSSAGAEGGGSARRTGSTVPAGSGSGSGSGGSR